MKTTTLVCLSMFPLALFAQDFVNLNLDNPDLTGSLRPADPNDPQSPFVGNTLQLLRGWTLLGDNVPLPEIGYTPVQGGFPPPVALFRQESSGVANYQLVFQSRPPNRVDLRMMQTGRIPDDAVGLSFFANGRMEMLVNGELLHRVDFNDTVFPTVDVSRFAGQAVNLEFHVAQGPAGASFLFDIGGFTQIPEPSTWALFGVGAAGLVWAGYWQRRS